MQTNVTGISAYVHSLISMVLQYSSQGALNRFNISSITINYSIEVIYVASTDLIHILNATID
jgi:hypothetical protein